MTSDELRAAFLNFFESQGHKVIPSSSLIPQGDPTLLLTTAGMVQVKPYFLGEAEPPGRRLASCQKCFRATDIESVGDSTHLTFFEMLGNFSVGDYFKKEAIAWAWQFFTDVMKLPVDRLWITVFTDDDEAAGYWREQGVAADRVIRLGEEDNFWGPAGDSGPCGPCSEILYDFGEEVGCRRDTCGPTCDCGRFAEIWNLVFTQYNQDKDGKRNPLPKPNIDTGMGLERLSAVMQGKTSVFETDLFVPLLEAISTLSGRKYGADNEADNAMRVVVEHSRGLVFLIADGVIPSNEGRGYVLRRLLRRAALFGKRLGLEKPFLGEIAAVVINQMGHVYPELAQRHQFILKVIESEEARFSETLNTGLEILTGEIAQIVKTAKQIGKAFQDIIPKETGKKKSNEISGKDTFNLYDTYGFPVELTREIAAERGLSVDMAGFEREMARQRQRAKDAQKFGSTDRAAVVSGDALDITETVFVGYADTTCQATVLSLLADNDSVGSIEAGQAASVILDKTPFYGEMGGQVGDTGEIKSEAGTFTVTDTTRMSPDIIVHHGRVTVGSLSVGDAVEAAVDLQRRLDIARNHTATHLLQLALRQVLGEHVQQRGSLVSPDHLRFDFSHLEAMTHDEIDRVNGIVNERIRQNLPVYDEELPYKQAVAAGALALFDEKYGDVVRVLSIARPAVSVELCGGTHVGATGEIGFFRITGESSIGAGLRRIEAVTGRGAEAHIGRLFTGLQEVARLVDASPENVGARVAATVSALEAERRLRQAEERRRARLEAEALLGQVEEIKGIKVIAGRIDSCRNEVLREMVDLLRDHLSSGIIVLGTVYQDKPGFVATVTPDLVARGYNAGKIVKRVAAVTGGGGGGKPTMAQAGGRHPEKLDEALRLVKNLL